MSETLDTIYDLLRYATVQPDPRPGIGFPREQDPADIDMYSVKQLHEYVVAAAKHFVGSGLQPIVPEKTKVVGLYNLANINSVVTFFALSRLGYTIFLISPCMQASALSALLEKTDCSILFYGPTKFGMAHEVAARRQIKLIPFRSLTHPGDHTSVQINQATHGLTETNEIAVIWHSSGSTGLPKLFPMTQGKMLVRSRVALTEDVCEFIGSASYNSKGMTRLLLSLQKKSPTWYWNESLTHTSDNLASILESLRPQRIFMTPYVLKCLAKTHRGIKALQDCQNVGSFEAPCPTPLGDMLMGQGIHLQSTYAS